MKALPPPEHGPDPGQQLAHVKGLGQIVVRPGVQPPDAVLQLGFGGEQQNGRLTAVFPQAGKDLKPVHFRQHNVQNDPVILPGQGIVVGVLTVVNRVHQIFMICEHVRHRL